MSRATLLTRYDALLRPTLTRVLPHWLAIKLYSHARKPFLRLLSREEPAPHPPPGSLSFDCWGISFRSSIFNAAGMFKNGECYQSSFLQGAGAWLCGTTTALGRSGNAGRGITHPFVPYPRSHAASNWLGLPNDGDTLVAARIARLPRHAGFPIGASIMASPDLSGDEALAALVSGMRAYMDAGVDFIELNESCPNTHQGRLGEHALARRLEYLKKGFLDQRATPKPVPVIVKFSADTDPKQVGDLLALLLKLNFDGVNFGNTSTNYQERLALIDPSEQALFRYFTQAFGGGVSGAPIAADARILVQQASQVLDKLKPDREFHIIRTGGISAARDVSDALRDGASLVQWYTGYFESFASHGYDTYSKLHAELVQQIA